MNERLDEAPEGKESFAFWTGYTPSKPDPADPARLIPLDREERVAVAARFRKGAERCEVAADLGKASLLREQADRLEGLAEESPPGED